MSGEPKRAPPIANVESAAADNRFATPATVDELAAMRIPLAALLASVTVAVTCAVEVRIEGLTMPFFDADGRMTHKLLAARGAAAGEQRRLEEVQVVYFAADDPTRIVQRLTATDALWSEKAGTLSGSGTVKVDTEDNHLSGVGYDFALETSVLRIHREFRMSNDDCVLTGDRATANLVIERAGDALKLRDLRQCQVEGHLHFLATKPNPSFPFQEAFTDLAIYDGVARTITMPHAVRTLGNGHEGTTHSAVIRLEPRRPASPKR